MNIITSVMSNKAIDQYLFDKKIKLQRIMQDLGHTIRYNKVGTVGEQLRYGPSFGPVTYVDAAWGASEVIKAASGRFVKTDGSGYLEIAGDGDSELVGWAEHREETVSSTEGGTKTQLNVNRETIYKIPINAGTLTRAMFYDTTDISVSSNIQGANLATADDDVLIIVGGDIANNAWLLVQINPTELGATGAA